MHRDGSNGWPPGYCSLNWPNVIQWWNIPKPDSPLSGVQNSISHTRGFAAVCISSRVSAGIDIEYPSERISRLETRFVNPQEASFIPADNQAVYHGLIWCAKETLYKMAATPGLIFKDDMLISPFKAENKGAMATKLFLNTEVKEYQLLYKVQPDYYLVWHY